MEQHLKNYVDILGQPLTTCILFSGQAREFQRAYPSIKKYLIDPLDATIVVSTWDIENPLIGK